MFTTSCWVLNRNLAGPMDYLINKRYADHRHGTGVQLKLFAGQLAEKPLHVCWDDGQGVKDTYEPVCNLNTSLVRKWPFGRGRGWVAKMETKLGRPWQDAEEITKRVKKFAPAKQGKKRAYVIIASEAEAKTARQVLGAVNAEYVVNVMDYLHLDSKAPPEYPEFAAILHGAKKVFALTPPIRAALADISGRRDITALGVAREPAQKKTCACISGANTFQIVMMGSVDYSRGLAELSHFCRGLDRTGIKYSLNYIGTQEMRERLGTKLPVNYQGVRLGLERDEMLNSMHLAYLPGPDGNPEEDYLARFSFPSRLTDYFWHGLPVVGPLFETSATAQMLSGLRGKGVWFSQDAKQLVETAKNLAQKPREWESASEAVYNFARRNFSIEECARTIMEAFDN
jgi:hypothetical protein